jgi:hypothetical protein
MYAGAAAWAAASRDVSSRVVFPLACAAVAFGMAGFGLILGALWGHKRVEQNEVLRERHPDQPWMWKPEWAARRISDQSRGAAVLLWAFALLWNAIASPALVFIPHEIERGHKIAALGFLFPLVGVVLLANAMRMTLRTLRFRQTTLVLDAVPVPIGGTLRGTVEVPNALANATAVMVRLAAIEKRTHGKSTTESTIAYEEREIEPSVIRTTGSGVVIPIEIAVPADAPPTDSLPRSEVRWRLTVDAEVPGIDYSGTFDVPVFRTAFSDSRPHAGPPPAAAPRAPKSFVERDGSEGRELHFAAFHAPAMAFTSLIFTAVWLSATAFLFVFEVPRVVTLIVALIAIPLTLSTLELFFESRTIILGGTHVRVRRRMFWTSEKSVAQSDIETADARMAPQTGGARPYYRVDIRTKAGKRIRAANNIRGKREAEWVAARIMRR